MIYTPEELEVGRLVYLFPHTKQASQTVHRQLAVSVMKDPKAHWPRVMVCWKEDGQDRWELVHRDNIKLRRSSSAKVEKRDGDTTQDQTTTSSRWQRRLAVARPISNIPDQMELF